jgi:hypothetical protein
MTENLTYYPHLGYREIHRDAEGYTLREIDRLSQVEELEHPVPQIRTLKSKSGQHHPD